MCEMTVPLWKFLAFTEPGDDDWSWRTQFRVLEDRVPAYLRKLRLDIRENGQRMAVDIGPDGRLWDGHHRVYCLVHEEIDTILINPVCENCGGADSRPAVPENRVSSAEPAESGWTLGAWYGEDPPYDWR